MRVGPASPRVFQASQRLGHITPDSRHIPIRLAGCLCHRCSKAGARRNPAGRAAPERRVKDLSQRLHRPRILDHSQRSRRTRLVQVEGLISQDLDQKRHALRNPHVSQEVKNVAPLSRSANAKLLGKQRDRQRAFHLQQSRLRAGPVLLGGNTDTEQRLDELLRLPFLGRFHSWLRRLRPEPIPEHALLPDGGCCKDQTARPQRETNP